MQRPQEGAGSVTPGNVPPSTGVPGDGTAPLGDKELNDLLDFSAVSCTEHAHVHCIYLNDLE